MSTYRLARWGTKVLVLDATDGHFLGWLGLPTPGEIYNTTHSPSSISNPKECPELANTDFFWIDPGRHDLNEWVRLGFSLNEACTWLFGEEVKFQLESASAWRAAGCDRDEAAQWFITGVRLDTVEALRGAGLTPEETLRWLRKARIGPRDLLGWKERGFTMEEAGKWKGSRFTAAQAGMYVQAGMPLSDAKEARRKSEKAKTDQS